MRALLDDVAVIDDDDVVGVFDRGQAVRDDEAGAALHEGCHRGLYLTFRPGVD